MSRRGGGPKKSLGTILYGGPTRKKKLEKKGCNSIPKKKREMWGHPPIQKRDGGRGSRKKKSTKEGGSP